LKTGSLQAAPYSPLTLGILWLALGLVLGLGVKDEVTQSGNESSRLATVEVLVEQGTFSIEASRFATVDRVRINDRFYSNKPLLVSLFLSVVYLPLHLSGLAFGTDYHRLIQWLTLFGVTAFSVLLCWMFQKRLLAIGVARLQALMLSLAVVFTTWIWSYGTSINNHTLSAAVLFALLWLLQLERDRPRRLTAVAAGLLAGLSMGIEIPTGGIFLVVGGLVLLGHPKQQRWKSVFLYGAGFLSVTLTLAAINYAVYGYPLDAYLVPGSFDFPESIHAPGMAGLRHPANLGSYLFHITFGQRGFWSHMPFLLLGVLYLWQQRRKLTSIDRWSVAGVLVLFLFYGTQTGIYGGWAYGFRFLVPLIPVFFWWSCRWLLLSPTRARQVVAGLLLAVGLVTSWVGTLNPWPVSYEGVATTPRVVEYHVRSPMLANLLVLSYERSPDGALFNWLAEDVYGMEVAVSYIAKEFNNRKQPEKLDALREFVIQRQQR
jgi:hypothetical protein